MSGVDEALRSAGFTRIGSLAHTLELSAWWSPSAKVEMLVLALGQTAFLRCSKSYFVTSRSDDGETWARDINMGLDYLEAHLPELHMTINYRRDVPEFLAERQARRRGTELHRDAPPAKDLGVLQRRIEQLEATSGAMARLRSLDSGDVGLLTEHLRSRGLLAQRDMEELRTERDRVFTRNQFHASLQREYRDKGSAMAIVITINANIHRVRTAPEAVDAISAAVKEIQDTHRFKVRQTFSGGRFKIGLNECTEPALAWIEQWFGGSLNPTQLALIEELDARTREALTRHTMVLPDEDIEVDGTLVDHRKLIAPRAVSAILDRVDVKRRAAQATSALGPKLRCGLRMVGDDLSDEPAQVELAQLDHCMLSGMTRSGKSFGQRILVEEVALGSDVQILVLDPRNQWSGLLAAQDRREVLERYPAFGLDRPRAFAFSYFAPGNPAAPLPPTLRDLVQRRSIVSLKALNDAERCGLFADILEAAFAECSRSETASTRLVVAVDEAQLFTKRLVAEEAKPSAERAETALNRLLREGRKFGILAVLSSQSMRDFSRESAAIRQNIGTKIFFHNSDREIEYARDYLDEPRELVRLPPGVAMVCNPQWGALKVAFRPPLSKVWDLSDAETVALFRNEPVRALSADAQHLIAAVEALRQQGTSLPNLTQAGTAVGITSKRRLLDAVAELERAGKVRTTRVPGRGRPRLIEAIASRQCGQDGQQAMAIPDETDQGGCR